MEDQYGFDAHFISEVPGYLKCNACHLVLRKPVQHMKCGHRFCEACFDRIKGFAQHLNTKLSCPVDRGVIELSQVFRDTGAARDVGNLEVKCSCFEKGCVWTGDLRDLEVHQSLCKYTGANVLRDETMMTGSSAIMELYRRIDKIEDTVMEKEKNILHLKLNLNELKKQFSDKEAEVESWKSENANLREEVEGIKTENQEFKMKFKLMENRLCEFKRLSEDNQISDKIIEFGINVQEIKDELNTIKNQIEVSVTEVPAEAQTAEVIFKAPGNGISEGTDGKNDPPVQENLINQVKKNMDGKKDVGEDHSIVEVQASILIYNTERKKWEPAGGRETISNVKIYIESNIYWIVGRRKDDNEFLLQSPILKESKFNNVTPTFLQWIDFMKIYGLNFQSPDDAIVFSECIHGALDSE